MPRSWSQLLGEENAQPEPDAERSGLFSRLRDSLSKSRRALTAELASAAFGTNVVIDGDVGIVRP